MARVDRSPAAWRLQSSWAPARWKGAFGVDCGGLVRKASELLKAGTGNGPNMGQISGAGLVPELIGDQLRERHDDLSHSGSTDDQRAESSTSLSFTTFWALV